MCINESYMIKLEKKESNFVSAKSVYCKALELESMYEILRGHKSQNFGIMLCKYTWGCMWLYGYLPFSSERVLCFHQYLKLIFVTTPASLSQSH